MGRMPVQLIAGPSHQLAWCGVFTRPGPKAEVPAALSARARRTLAQSFEAVWKS